MGEPRRRGHRAALAAGSAAVLTAVLVVAGPRVEVDTRVPETSIPDPSIGGVAAWIAESEARYDDIVPGTEKALVWSDSAHPAPTPLAVVYLHGFSATRQEVHPLAEEVAASLGANLFLTRLTGHGRGPDAMAEASVNDWLRDGGEALAVGRVLGSRTVLVGTSTGGTLALWLAAQPRWRDEIAAVLLVSPNLGIPDPRARVLLWPWGGVIARLVQGPERSFEPLNDLQERYWTTRYPTEALLPLMATVRLVEGTDLDEIRAPVYVAYNPRDEVVDPSVTERRIPEIGGASVRLDTITVAAGTDAHVLAGDIVHPELTLRIRDAMLRFLWESGVTGGGVLSSPEAR